LSAAGKVRLSTAILATYGRVRWAMRHRDLEAVVGRFRAIRAAGDPPLARRDRHRLAIAVGRVLEPLPTDSRCLVRSLVLLALLAKRGVHSTLVIGVAAEPQFAAHAWIECEGEPLLPTGGGEFARLTAI
jgi:hypothetical protein